MPAEERLQLRIGLTRGSFTLDVDFEARPGITVLFGPSGAGKSTTLAAIAGLVRPERGAIALGDEPWFDAARGIDRPVHLRGVAFVFQTLALFPHMTALANVEYGIARALDRAARRARAEAMLARWKVPHLAHRKPATFSGGEAQRVALARAFAIQPRIVLLDEPFSAMDRRLRHELSNEFRSVIDELQIPAIHVTHHRKEARALADRVVLIESGRILAAGAASELLADREGADEMGLDKA